MTKKMMFGLLCVGLVLGLACGHGGKDSAADGHAHDGDGAGHHHDGDGHQHDDDGGHGDSASANAKAMIEARSGSAVSGVAAFSMHDGRVTLELKLGGLTPGSHAVHLHEVGDCSAPDGKSAGGHWNPSHAAHGKWDDEPFHLGDIGNVEAGADGRAQLSLTTANWSIGTGAANDIVGTAIIVHEKEDDFMTQPTGGAGGRVGCGVVQ